MHFEVFPRKVRVGVLRRVRTRWFWHLKAMNNEIVAQSEAYTAKASAIKTCEAIANGVDSTTLIVELDE